jgi:hypothetical protein
MAMTYAAMQVVLARPVPLLPLNGDVETEGREPYMVGWVLINPVTKEPILGKCGQSVGVFLDLDTGATRVTDVLEGSN